MTSPQIGVCTWTYGDLPLEEIFRRIQATGFDGVELFGDLQKYRPKHVLDLCRQHHLQIFSLTPDDVDLAHPDPATRLAAVDYYTRLLDFAAKLGRPLVSCHGCVGRVRASATQQEEENWLQEGVYTLGRHAQSLGLRVVVEVLNRYESHLVNTAADARRLVDALADAPVGILLDAYHMNIEERDLHKALRVAGDRLWLFHVADSNREGIGRGHTDFAGLFEVLGEIGYDGPVILECTAPGPDPFLAIKDEDSYRWLETYHRESVDWLRKPRA